MGGNAFTLTHNLYTPRMPLGVYQKVLSRARAHLLTVFDKVESPIEGPAKEDYGDIDFLVLLADGQKTPSVAEVARLLGAEHHTNGSAGTTVSYAVRWPGDGDHLACQVNELSINKDDVVVKPKGSQKRKGDTTISNPDAGSELGAKPKPRYIQIDVHVCPNPQVLDCTLFLHAHGDLWSILGTVIRPYGLTCTQQAGLTVRIPELENVNKNLARFTLTYDPDAVLRYLGLDVAQYHSRFKTWDDLFAYISTSRFFRSKRTSFSLESTSIQRDEAEQDKQTDKDVDSETTVKAPRLTSHDRRKAVQRPLFRYWLDVWLPSHPDLPTGSASHMTRDQVIADAKSYFGPEISEAFDQHRAIHVQAMMVDKTWSDIRKFLPCEGSDLTYTMKGLKFEIVQEAQTKVLTELSEVQLAWSEARYQDVKKWAAENWEDVKTRQVIRMREQSSTKLREHHENERKRNGPGGPADANGGDAMKVWNFYHR